jgi:hypothetical protein
MGLRLRTLCQQFTKIWSPQNLAECRKCLLKDLDAVGNEQHFRWRSCRLRLPKIVKCGHDRLARTGRRNHQIAKAAMAAFGRKAFQHRLLKSPRPKVKPSRHRDNIGTCAGLSRLTQSNAQPLPVILVGGVKRLKLRVIPECFEMCRSR